MSNVSIYLAGPEVFLPDGAAVGLLKRLLCDSYGFTGLYPLDNEVPKPALGTRASSAIFAANLALMRSADLVIANLTPFRGPSADPGTVFEIGFMMGLGRPGFGYSNAPGTYLDKVRAQDDGVAFDAGRGAWVDSDSMTVEDFGVGDNLMITESLEAGGLPLVVSDTVVPERFRDLRAFERCLQLVRRKLGADSAGRRA
jgi:nucleoside 2-deoxyribosyltransferase